MATHPNIPAWKISWTEEPGGLQSMGSKESDRLKRRSAHARSKCFTYTSEEEALGFSAVWLPQRLVRKPLTDGRESHSSIRHLSPEGPGGLDLGAD